MKRNCLLTGLILIVIVSMGIVGCGKEDGSQKETALEHGSIVFEIDSPSVVSTHTKTKSVDLTMTNASINLHQSDSGASESLMLSVEDNKASGRLDDLEVGVWDVYADVQTDEGYYFHGETQVTVQAGIAVGVNLLLDADDVDYQVGSIIFNIGFNPLPGYKKLAGISAKTVLAGDYAVVGFNDAGDMIMYDSMLENPVSFEMPYEQAPIVSCLGEAGDKAYAGFVAHEDGVYRDIEIFEINLMTGSYTSITSSPSVVSMQCIEADALLLVHEDMTAGFSSIDIFNPTTAMTSGGYSFGTSGTDFVYNPSNKKIYHTYNDTLESVMIDYDSYSGYYNFSDYQYVDYVGTYTLNPPLALMASKGRLITGAGDMFTSSLDAAVDMTHAGNIGMPFVDFEYLSGDSHMLLVSDTADKELVVLDDINYLPVTSVPLAGNHEKLFVTDQFVYVLAEYEETVFAKVWDKSFLIEHL